MSPALLPHVPAGKPNFGLTQLSTDPERWLQAGVMTQVLSFCGSRFCFHLASPAIMCMRVIEQQGHVPSFPASSGCMCLLRSSLLHSVLQYTDRALQRFIQGQ
jgi:hypothetical protein